MNNPGQNNTFIIFLKRILIAFWACLPLMAGNCLAEGLAQGSQIGECTIAVFSGNVTLDGRPIIWKNRDVGDHNQRYIYYSAYRRNGITTYKFIGNCYRTDTTRIYMGANEQGFAIMNSDSYNLHNTPNLGLDDGTLMRLALETCASLADFEAFLDSTNQIGRTFCWNFGCLDSSGNCALYECANRSYVKFDPLDPRISSPGYIARSNFSFSGDSTNLSIYGLDRYQRADYLIRNRLDSTQITANWVLSTLARDLANRYANPYPLPYMGSQNNAPPGYIYNYISPIDNRSTTSAVAIRGIRAGDDPALNTIFAILGQPILSVAFPLWVKSGEVPYYLSAPGEAPVHRYCVQRSSLLYDNRNFSLFINSRYLFDQDSGGVYSYTFPLEAWGIQQADFLLEGWEIEPPTTDDVVLAQYKIANKIFYGFENETARFLDDSSSVDPNLPIYPTLYSFPNPFNSGTHIVYSGARNGFPVILRIYDIRGRLVTELARNGRTAGDVYWSGKDSFGNSIASGIYFCRLDNGPYKSTNKMVLLK